ncbi:MAG: TonB-dependent receptor plug domain-containing protein [Saprospiraceae bacterium]|nr:TonB-dependent receptor plug domain-containing protein [Saprospiraceae bacterium]
MIIVGCSFAGATAQTCLLSGRLTDADSREPLAGASVYCPVDNTLAITDDKGGFSLLLNARYDSVIVVFNQPGYHSLQRAVRADTQDVYLEVALENTGHAIQEVVVEANNLYREKLSSTQTSLSTLTALEAKALPALLGEVDIIKTLQLKPGIIPGPEGTTGLFVRGGSSDQNLVLLDGATVYNANHLFGFFSTFNADAIDQVSVYKGGFPAHFGGRLSAVLDVGSRTGDLEDFSVSGGLGLISSRLTLEGPLQKGKHSFLVSGRRTYADVITRTINHLNRNVADYNPIPDYYFYDLNAGLHFTLSPKDRLTVSSYLGKDDFHFVDDNFDFDFDWGNTASTARWRHLFNDQWSSDLSVVYSRYQYNIENRLDGFFFRAGSTVQDAGIRAAMLHLPHPRRSIRFGLDATNRRFDVARLNAGSNDGQIRFSSGQRFEGTELAVHATEERQISARWRLSTGLRASAWLYAGDAFFGLEPRLSTSYSLHPVWTLKASYVRMYQYAHLLAGTGLSLPTDLWYPGTSGLRPQISDQFTAGVVHVFQEHYLFTWEAWYKKMQNQIDLIDGADLYRTPDLESQLTIGQGYAFSPMELEFEKKNGRLTGWVGYTLAWVRRGDFPDVNGGRYYAPRYDARHNASVVAMYRQSKRWQFTGTFVYTSGYAAWLPEGRFTFSDIPGVPAQPVVPVYGDRNTFRYPAYWRLDLGVIRKFKTRKGAEHDLTFSLYNATGRRNPYFIYLDPGYETVLIAEQPVKVPTSIQAKQVSLFPALPSVTWNFKF